MAVDLPDPLGRYLLFLPVVNLLLLHHLGQAVFVNVALTVAIIYVLALALMRVAAMELDITIDLAHLGRGGDAGDIYDFSTDMPAKLLFLAGSFLVAAITVGSLAGLWMALPQVAYEPFYAAAFLAVMIQLYVFGQAAWDWLFAVLTGAIQAVVDAVNRMLGR